MPAASSATLPDKHDYLPGTKVTKPRLYRVGPGRFYSVPSQVASIAQDGDTVEIDAGLYERDVAIWRQNRLTLRGVGGRAHLASDGQAAQEKGIWVIKGDDVTVERIEFSGARVYDRNGAGIRFEGRGLTVRDSFFHDNENGILTGGDAESDILVEYSEFARNGHGDGYSHNIYVGKVRSFTLRYSYMHHARIGHNVKTRARLNRILYNRIMDEATGNSSYLVDFSNGGTAIMVGNLLHQGRRTDNSSAISYAAEGSSFDTGALFVINNSFVNDRPGGRFLQIRGKPVTVRVHNNIVVGVEKLGVREDQASHNFIGADPGFKNRTGFDYRLRPGSPAIDAGILLGSAAGERLTADRQYIHRARGASRRRAGRVDLGAYEFARSGAAVPAANRSRASRSVAARPPISPRK
ncbi:MAG: choice-of-anchor Q domain-containing protein [Alphaproteobacteria bacterium]